MGFLKKKQPKKFKYQSRYYKGDGNPYEIKQKFEDFREDTAPPSGVKSIKNKLVKAINSKDIGDNAVRKRLFIIIAILVLIVLYIIDFDLTIFF